MRPLLRNISSMADRRPLAAKTTIRGLRIIEAWRVCKTESASHVGKPVFPHALVRLRDAPLDRLLGNLKRGSDLTVGHLLGPHQKTLLFPARKFSYQPANML